MSSKTWTLVAAVLGSSIVFLDSAVLTVALPAIGRDLGAGVAALQWTLNASASAPICHLSELLSQELRAPEAE